MQLESPANIKIQDEALPSSPACCNIALHEFELCMATSVKGPHTLSGSEGTRQGNSTLNL